jgi:serine/threonine protein kinase
MEIIIYKKYRLMEKIGEGSFGNIYKGENIRTRENVAIKVEPIGKNSLLKNESIIYQYLKNTKGIPSIKWFGKDNLSYYMVINLLGESLQSIKNKKHIFSQQEVLHTGIQLITLLESIHEKGLVHRDIKPDNFLYGLNNEIHNVYIIDFGFCKSFIQKNKHISFKKTNNLIGSKTYASINAHNLIELSRRDDLESLGYILIYLYLGTLSWRDIGDCENTNEQIKFLKEHVIDGQKVPFFLENYIKYVRGLKFEEKPNYLYLKNNFTKELDQFEKK